MRRMAWIELEELMPMSVPFIRDRERILDEYARRYVESFEGIETVRDYCYQAGLDIGDKTVAVDLAVRIRKLCRKPRESAVGRIVPRGGRAARTNMGSDFGKAELFRK